MEFENQTQAYEALKFWKHLLFIDHWIVKISFVEKGGCNFKNTENNGLNEFVISHCASHIKLENPTEDSKGRIVKCCQEQILIHELLHLKYNWVMNTDTYEGKFLEESEHQLLEQMSRSLLIARYNLTPDWFINFKTEE